VEWSLSVQHVLLPKAGLLKFECEDSIGLRRDTRRFCVADGATEAYDSGRWARLLTKHWTASSRLLTSNELAPWLRALGERMERRWAKKPLPWYAEEKARGGAFAALVGLAFFGSGDGGPSWQAIALGDSCLVHRRHATILRALPLSDPEAFGYHPTLIPSKPARQEGIADQFIVAAGMAQPGDVFLLFSDAIAAWYLRLWTEDPTRVADMERLLESNDATGLEELIAFERSRLRLRNDDIAIVRILVSPDAPSTVA
jgi:hypothetical protein